MRAAIPIAFLGVVVAGCAPVDVATSADTLVPIAPSRGGAVVVDADRDVAWAADADLHAIVALDLTTSEVRTFPIDGAPEQIAKLGDDGLAVTLRDRNVVAIYTVDATGDLHEAGRVEVPNDPCDLAVSGRGEILVTSGYAHALTSIDAATLATRWSIDLPREPRAIAITADGARAFVTHVVGASVSVVDLVGAPRARTIEALGGRYRDRLDRANGARILHPVASLAYDAVFSSSGTRLFVPHLTEQNGATVIEPEPGTYGGVPVEEKTSIASVAVIGVADERVLGEASAHGEDGAANFSARVATGRSSAEAAPSRQARAAAIFEDELLVASQGTDELVALDARAIDPALAELHRYAVGHGPRGVAVDPSTRIAVVYAAFDHAFSIVDLDRGNVESVVAAKDPLDASVARGRKLFTTERDRRISRDGRACSACHPEGRDDGVVWKLGQGPRQTPTLAGRLEHGPYGWLARHDKLEDNVRETIGRLGGSGLDDKSLADLTAFLRRGIVAPVTRARAENDLVARGRSLFESPNVGCAACHRLDEEGSDRQLHTVGSKTKDDVSAAFRTPPLRFVGNTAPYFHDGRYATLEALLRDNLDRMGQTSQLSDGDLDALAAFLRTL